MVHCSADGLSVASLFAECRHEQIRCDDGICISRLLAANTRADCLDGSDESIATRSQVARDTTCKHNDIFRTSTIMEYPYRHSTSGPLAGRQRLAATGQLANPHPLGGSGSGRKAGCWWPTGGRLQLSLPFYPLARLCVYRCSASLVLGANSQHQATTLPTPAVQGRLQASYGWLDSGG